MKKPIKINLKFQYFEDEPEAKKIQKAFIVLMKCLEKSNREDKKEKENENGKAK